MQQFEDEDAEGQVLLPPQPSSKRERIQEALNDRNALDFTETSAPLVSETTSRANRSAMQLHRQEQCYLLHVAGKTIRAVAQEMHLCTNTVLSDIRFERERVAEEEVEGRDYRREASMSFYGSVKQLAAEEYREWMRLVQERGVDVKMASKALDVMLKAQERIDRLQGLDAAIKVELGIQPLLTALDSDLPD